MRTRNTSNKGYTGPNPKDINSEYPEHTYELITCLINGEQKKKIEPRYLRRLGWTKEEYQAKFPGAPFISNKSSDNYAKTALNDGGRRSKNMTELNNSGTDSKFQNNRRKGHDEWLLSDDSAWYRQQMADKAKEQHKNGLGEAARDYFRYRYPDSEDQKKRSKRMTGDNNIVHIPGVIDKIAASWIKNHDAGLHYDPKGTRKKKYKDYPLTYQSSYELHFLELCEELDIIDRIVNAKTMRDEQYPRKYYLPDYVLDNEYIIEIKCDYIERLQANKDPQHITEKQQLVERHGYKWLYIKDKNYSPLLSIIQGLSGKVGCPG